MHVSLPCYVGFEYNVEHEAKTIDIIRKGLETGRFNTNQQVPSMYGNKMAESMDCDAVTVVGNLL